MITQNAEFHLKRPEKDQGGAMLNKPNEKHDTQSPGSIVSVSTEISYLPKTMTGLQDYFFWSCYAQEQGKTDAADTQKFRRGRIWA